MYWNKGLTTATSEKLREIGRKISIANRGRVVGNKGKTKETFPLLSRSGVKKGNIPWNKGKHPSKETLERQSKSHLGKVGYWRGKTRPSPTREVRLRMSEAHRGEKSYLWRGGPTVSPELDVQIRRSFEYRLWRASVFRRDDYTCQDCGTRGCYLEAHHIKRFSKILIEHNIGTFNEALNCVELWDVCNGKTLCNPCHNKTKKKGPSYV